MARLAGGVSQRAQLLTLLLIQSVIVVGRGAVSSLNGDLDTPPNAIKSPAQSTSSVASSILLLNNNNLIETAATSALIDHSSGLPLFLSDQPSNSNNNKKQLQSSVTTAASPISVPYQFQFAHSSYNVSIPENSVGKTNAIQPPNEDRMGIYITSDLSDVKYRIVGGDKDKIFKAEERVVGDFAFLVLRTRTGNVVLNREKDDHYKLEVRATGTKREGKTKLFYEADTIINVRVQDTNDLSPLFYPTDYAVTIPEDTPLHKSILRVIAEDADLGVNGEIYYSLLDETEQFSVHPTSGVITLTRPLKFAERSVHELTVVANDRGRSSTTIVNRINQASKAKVKIKVKQVRNCCFYPFIRGLYVIQF